MVDVYLSMDSCYGVLCYWVATVVAKDAAVVTVGDAKFCAIFICLSPFLSIAYLL